MSTENFLKWLIAEFKATDDIQDRYEIINKLAEHDATLAYIYELQVNETFNKGA